MTERLFTRPSDLLNSFFFESRHKARFFFAADLAPVWDFGLLRLFFSRLCLLAIVGLILLNAGCASMISSRLVGEEEKKAAVELLRRTLSRQAQCQPFVDSRMVISFDSFFRSGTLGGYLLAKSPAEFSFVGLGPLEQPILFFNSDGKDFQLVIVPEGKAYLGKTAGETFSKYFPAGLQPQRLFYWLIGGMEPGALEVIDVKAAREGDGFWFDINGSEKGVMQRIFIDQNNQQITRHLLFDPDGEMSADVSYQWSQDPACCLPSLMTIESARHSLTLKLSFSACKMSSDTNKVNFKSRIPPFYKKVSVP